MQRHGSRYSVSKRRRLIDSDPMKQGEAPLVWLKDRHEWEEMDVSSGEHADAVPVTDEEAERICVSGEIPERIIQYGRMGDTEEKDFGSNEGKGVASEVRVQKDLFEALEDYKGREEPEEPLGPERARLRRQARRRGLMESLRCTESEEERRALIQNYLLTEIGRPDWKKAGEGA